MFTTPRQLVVSLILTWLIEWAVAAVILRRSDWRLAYNVLLINALTNPPAMAAAREFDVNFWLVEGLVCAVEVPLYRLLLHVSWRLALVIGLATNALSASAGILF